MKFMWHSSIRFSLAVLAMLVLTSQSLVAVESACAGMQDHPDPAMTMVMTPELHEAGHAETDLAAGVREADCCDHQQCAQADCVSVSVAAIASHGPFAVDFSQTLTPDYFAACVPAVTPSLYRPPIFS